MAQMLKNKISLFFVLCNIIKKFTVHGTGGGQVEIWKQQNTFLEKCSWECSKSKFLKACFIKKTFSKMYSLECWRTVALCSKTSNMPFMTSLAFSPQNSQVSKSTPKQARRILDEVKKNNLLALVNESSRVLIFRDKKGAKIHKKVHFSDCKHGVDRSGF